jgi:GNAT superfamily N-acetyltransferase
MKELALRIARIEYGGERYAQAVALREEVLRKPLGLRFGTEELAAERDYHHYAAFIDDTLVGSVFFFGLNETRIQFRQMAVAPALHGRGVGRALLSHMESEAAAQGFNEAFAEARIEALPFYLKLGYRIFGEQYLHVGIAHQYILKNLRSDAR